MFERACCFIVAQLELIASLGDLRVRVFVFFEGYEQVLQHVNVLLNLSAPIGTFDSELIFHFSAQHLVPVHVLVMHQAHVSHLGKTQHHDHGQEHVQAAFATGVSNELLMHAEYLLLKFHIFA